MKIRQFVVLSVLFTVLLPACHPTYTAKQTEYYARKIGVTNQFDINRRHSRAIDASSRLCVVSEHQQDIDVGVLSNIVAKGLSAFFHKVNTAEHATSIDSAAAIARKNRADFAIYIRMLDSNSLFSDEKSGEPSDYHRLQLLLIIVDAISGQVMDKVQLLAKSPRFSLVGQDMQSLLAKPIERIGRDLSGV